MEASLGTIARISILVYLRSLDAMLNLWYDLYWYGSTMTVGNHRFSGAAHTSLHNWLELLEALPKNFRGLPLRERQLRPGVIAR